jgi:hypothetical protein
MTTGLFKYFPTDEDKLEWFAKGQILLSPPKYFNDPWDFLVHSEPYTDAELENRAKELEVSLQSLKQASMESDFLSEESLDYQEQISKLVGVVCLNENPVDRTMAAYYAESHRGFVAEFRHGEEANAEGIKIRPGPFGQAGKVLYVPQQPLLKRDLSNMAEVIWAKHSSWQNEREWRVVQSLDKASRGQTRSGEERFLINFEPAQLVRVIFGIRASSAVKAALKTMLARSEYRHVRQEEMVVHPTSRELATRVLPT